MNCKLDNRTEVESVAIRFSGDSGDGMQLTGSRFTIQSAQSGRDLATLPSFPAEIRAPAGTVAGVSSFQINFGSVEIYTAGDDLDVLVAMNPAALKDNLVDLKPGGILICNEDGFSKRNLAKAGYKENPLDDKELSLKYTLVKIPLTRLTRDALEGLDLPTSSVDRCKNFFALGVVSWIYNTDVKSTRAWIENKFKGKELIIKANSLSLEGGMAFAEASEIITNSYQVKNAPMEPGKYRNVTGNLGIALGLAAASHLMDKPVMYAGYPITPASDILHEVSSFKKFGIITMQMEDEISACCAAIGSSFSGRLGVTASSGPGIILKQEAIGLAAMTELPLVVINVQRAGPSTGMPTKPEQADLLEMMYGRNGESPCVILAVATPGDAFDTTVEACRIACDFMVPVFLVSDAFIANGAEPWKIPDINGFEPINADFPESADDFQPYSRNQETLARKWAVPGMAGFEHRIGGIEKKDITGNISYDPENHQHMIELRQEKVNRVAKRIPPIEVDGPEAGKLLILSWGSTYASIKEGIEQARKEGFEVSHVHLRYLNPLPDDLGDVLSRFSKVLIPEMNSGHLKMMIRSRYLIDAEGFNKIQGKPFRVREILEKIREQLSGENAGGDNE